MNYYSYAYITKDGKIKAKSWVLIPKNKPTPKIPNINYPITENVIPYAKAH